MKIFPESVIILVQALLFYSCDPQTCGVAYIQNESSGNVYLECGPAAADTLPAGETKMAGPVCGLAQGQTPSGIVYYRQVRNEDTVCRKDIRQDTNWKSSRVGKYKNGSIGLE